MNRLTRLTALLLAMLMIFSTVAAAETAYQVGGMTVENWQEIVDSAEEKLFTIDEGDSGKEVTPPPVATPTPGAYYPYTDGTTTALAVNAQDSTTQMTASGVAVLQNAEAGQWQMQIGGTWINITGATGSELWATSAMMNGMESANFRKAFGERNAETGEYASYTNVATVEIVAEVAGAMFMMSRAAEDEGEAAPTVTPPPAANDIMTVDEANDKITLTIQYVNRSNIAVASAYTASFTKGSSFTATVTHPSVVGYLPTFQAANSTNLTGVTVTPVTTVTADNETVETGVTYSFTNLQADSEEIKNITISIVYQPTTVAYKVEHYWQNLDNDEYTLHETEDKTGLTEALATAAAKDYGDGFYNLLFETPTIAANGSTVVKIYYNRYYFLMNFDMGGGYGVEPVYAKYGATIPNVGTPTLAGFTFKGWSATKNGAVDTALPPASMPAGHVTYYAVWGDAQLVDYTIVYWRENANDNGYSYWKQTVVQNGATAGTYIDGSDSLATEDTLIRINNVDVYEKDYFTYNDALTQKHVYVNGDGSTVVNVYYTRNVYTITFYYDGDCLLETHTHTDPDYTGTDACYQFACDIPEHDHDVDGCTLKCNETVHVHGACENCTIAEHTAHTRACYGSAVTNTTASTTVRNSLNNNYTRTQGMVGRYRQYNWQQYTYYIYIDGTWYQYNSTQVSAGTTAPTTCQGLHTHDDGTCICDIVPHVHGDACYTCGQTEHTHTTEACYKLTCGKTEHTHSDANCRYGKTYGSGYSYEDTRDYKIFKVITAKYDANIDWPTADVVPDNSNDRGFAYWTGDGVGNQSSKIVTMTYNICTDGGGEMLAHYNTTEYYLNYMFESFDQTSPANGTTRIRHSNGKYYDKSDLYSQTAYYGSTDSWGYKDITGMTPAGNNNGAEDNIDSNNNAWLYYDRLRYTFNFVSKTDTLLTTGKTVMFEQPLYNYSYNGTLLRTFKPAEDYYPEGLEEGAYYFEGWYTTPECYEGTKYTFVEQNLANGVTGSIMPNSDMTLYANWAKIRHTVNFYLTEDATTVYDPPGSYTDEFGMVIPSGPASLEVPHGTIIAKEYVEANLDRDAMNSANPLPRPPYTFDHWYYYDENGDQVAFDPVAPITRDMDLYAYWTADVLVPYRVQYVYVDGTGTEILIAEDETGSGLAGSTKTFDAKVGAELYDFSANGGTNYQVGFYPSVTRSNNVEMVIEYEDEAQTVVAEVVYKFYYYQRDKMPYKVYYLAKELKEGDTGLGTHKIGEEEYYIIAATDEHNDNRSSVVTEEFKVVAGYMPDAYQKQLVLSADESQNVIYFFYSVDSEHAYYKMSHHFMNLDGTTYTETASEQLIGVIGNMINHDPIDVLPEGFSYERTGIVVSGAETPGTSAELTAEGLEIKHYYKRNPYPYTVHYYLNGTTTSVHADKVVEGKLYGTCWTEQYVDLSPAYRLVGADTQSITIGIDITKNVIIFYYEEQLVNIAYVAVGDGGSVSVNSENLNAVSGVATGSVATAMTGYTFDGWYVDAACTNRVTEADGTVSEAGAKFVPGKEPATDQIKEPYYVDATFYAKFTENEATITYIPVGPDNHILTEAEKLTVGNVNPSTENVKVVTGNANGSTATPVTPTYRFEGWYSDETCTTRVSSDPHFVPTQPGRTTGTDGVVVNGLWPDTTTYYAKFEWNVADLTITKAFYNTDDVPVQFRDMAFTVKVSLPVGEYDYTVTDANGTVKVDKLNVTDGTASLDIKAGQKIVIKGIQIGSNYSVEEQNPSYFNVSTSRPAGSVFGVNTDPVNLVNTYVSGRLSITKKLVVADGITVPEDTKYPIMVTLMSTTSIDGEYSYTVNGTTKQATFKNGVATIDLAAGETATLTLPAGVRYLVSETETNEYYLSGTPEEQMSLAGTIGAGTDSTVTLTNVYKYGNLKITKTVTGENAPGGKFSFIVTLGDKTINGTYGDATFKDGVATVELDVASGETKTATITGLPGAKVYGYDSSASQYEGGTTYTVEEVPVAGYVSTPGTESGWIVAAETAMAEFTNTYTVGHLSITKKVEGKYAPANDEFEITVNLTAAAGAVLADNGYPVTGGILKTYTLADNKQSATLTLTLKDGETATIENIQTGTQYSVVENEAHYDKVYANAQGTISKGETAAVTVTNTYRYSTLTIRKKGMEPGESAIFEVKAYSKYNNDQETTFTVTVPNDGFVTIGELLIGKGYTITEIGSWSNRYAVAQPVTGEIDKNGSEVTITNTGKNQQWLHGEDYVHNDFSKPGSYAN